MVATRQSIARAQKAQLTHWTLAIDRLRDLEDLAAANGWAELERHAGTRLRSALGHTVENLAHRADAVARAADLVDWRTTHDAIHALRRDYQRVETTLDFFADAINTRTSPETSALLIAADKLASGSMRSALAPLGHEVPPVLTYIDKGLGASILKQGLRLWDQRSINPVAAIKVVRHNLLSPTSILHEAGHQVAHVLGWNGELSHVLATALPGRVARVWASWASEIAADAFAFAHAGYASVAALRNVVDGGPRLVFRYLPGDPHPVGFLRVLLGIQMCNLSFGPGPWNEMAAIWNATYPPERAPSEERSLVSESLPLLRRVARLTLRQKFGAFAGRALTDLVDPARVSPRALADLERMGGPRLFSSPSVVSREAIRLLALSGYRFATTPERGAEFLRKQRASMLTLGGRPLAA
jgi:hypothetical protein